MAMLFCRCQEAWGVGYYFGELSAWSPPITGHCKYSCVGSDYRGSERVAWENAGAAQRVNRC